MKSKLSVFTIFLGSFLVFGVQPMVGRTILPVFGGTAAVWVVCLCAFQVLLLAGYFYAHCVTGGRRVLRVHAPLLILSALMTAAVALGRNSILSRIATGFPAIDALACVLLLTGFSYVLLSANSSLVQAVTGGAGVYRLYAVSNFGSLCGLLAYPFILEPYVSLTTQWLGFAIGIVIYAVPLSFCVNRTNVTMGQESSNQRGHVLTENIQSSKRQSFLWLLLPATSCFLLNALTTYVTLDIMPLPLVWTGSLAIFLLSYIVGFSGKTEKLVSLAAFLTLGVLVWVCWLNGKPLVKIGLPAALVCYSLFLFLGCTFLHAWLYVIRPSDLKLTRYYLFQSLGGAIGGSVASLAFPQLAKTIAEYPVSLIVVASLALVCSFKLWSFVARLALVALAAYLYVVGGNHDMRPCVYRGRGFFGTIEVLSAEARTSRGGGYIHEFIHGSTVHGIQALIPGKERMPTVYYTPNAVGYGIVAHPKYRRREPMRVNLVGLGVGVVCAYGRKGDYYRAYEISQDALKVATDTNLFTFVSGNPAKTDIVLGDARMGLEAELAAGVEPYDVIIVDAFTGDNIPYHLSSVEAFDLYFKLLKPDGILVINISNWHLQLEPFMAALGDRYKCPLLGLITQDDYAHLQFAAKVAIFCRDPSGLAPPPIGDAPNQARMVDYSRIKPMRHLPTDEKGSFLSLVNW